MFTYRSIIKVMLSATFFTLSLQSVAGGIENTNKHVTDTHYFAMASMGYGAMSGANINGNSGQTVFANLDIGWRFYKFRYGTLDILGDVMSGNRFNTVQLVQGLSASINIQPTLAILMGVNFAIPQFSHWVFSTQFGARLMRATFDITGINNMTTVRPDLRFQIKRQLIHSLALVAMYQHTFGNNPLISVNTTTFVGTLNDVPSINVGSIGLEFDF